jgi:peptidyl-prolyl cis-trans isomerase SurA
VRRVTLLTVPVLALSLAACGGGSGPQPGTAMAVGDQRVTTRHVSDVASRYCSALAKVGSSATTQTVQNQVVGALAARMIAEDFAQVRGIDPGATYQADVAKLRPQLAQFDQATQDAIIEVEGAQSYVSAIVDQVGEPSFTEWLKGQHVTVNPVYGLSVDAGNFTHHDPSLSVATSDLAKGAVKSAANPSASPAPNARTCG